MNLENLNEVPPYTQSQQVELGVCWLRWDSRNVRFWHANWVTTDRLFNLSEPPLTLMRIKWNNARASVCTDLLLLVLFLSSSFHCTSLPVTMAVQISLRLTVARRFWRASFHACSRPLRLLCSDCFLVFLHPFAGSSVHPIVSFCLTTHWGQFSLSAPTMQFP
jgi:hypothetical protein